MKSRSAAADANFEIVRKNTFGQLYANGHGVTRDYARAREWYEKAADKGEALGMFGLGRLYYLAQDYAKAREWYEKAADKGDANAMTDLGVLYATGEGVARDRSLSMSRKRPAGPWGRPEMF